jgi:hypothetical protein
MYTIAAVCFSPKSIGARDYDLKCSEAINSMSCEAFHSIPSDGVAANIRLVTHDADICPIGEPPQCEG